MKRVALTLALMMLVGTLATPLLDEFHDEMPLILDVEGPDVLNSGRGSGNEYLSIDHSGHVYQHQNGTKVWDSNTTVTTGFGVGNLTVGSNYNLTWELFYVDNNHAFVQSDNQSFTAYFNSTMVDVVDIAGLADGTYQFEAVLWNDTGHYLAGAVSLIMMGNNSGTSAGNGQVYVDIDHSGYVYEHPNGTEVWASGSDVYVEFTSGNLTIGEEYQLIWNLSDSTSNWGHVTGHYGWNISWNATSTTSVENSTISGLADGVYYFHATLVNQGSHVATDMTMIQVGNNTGGSGGSGGTTGPAVCNLDVLPSTRPHNGGPNQTEWTYGVDIFDAYAHHTCLDAGMYDWNFSLYDANGHMPAFYEDGMFEIHDDDAGSHFDFHVRNFEATDLPVGHYTWWYGISNYTMGISEWAHHNFTVVDSTASQSCSELETERLQQYYYAEESAVNTILVDCPAAGEAIEVYWKVTQYQDGTIMDDGWWNTTATSTSMSHTVETDDLPIGVWYAFSATMYTDNGTLYEWHSFNIIPSYNPNPGPDEMCGESNARTSIHVTNDANTNTYMGHEYYSDDDFNHEISLDCLITNSTYEVEYILTHYHTGYLVDAGWWNFTATGPTASITETWSNLPIQIWYAVTAMYTFDNGVTISDYEKFYVNSTTGPDLLGYCSFPTFEATPASVQSGDDLTFTWTMDGDVTDDVYLSLNSGWGAQYYFSSVVDNDGSHTITLPTNMNPNEDYTVYIESASNGQRTTVCWKYGSIDVLEDDEGVVLDDIINDFLNTTDERPRISMWYGKVNQHNWNGTWMTDPDGVAGAGLYSQWGSEGWGDRKLEYCQRFWPDTVEIRNSAPEEIVFYTRGNTDAYLTMKPVWLCVQDTDGDGILDPEDEDDDGDGWPDIFEDLCLSDALDPNVMPEDLDGDGLCDVLQILLVGDFEPPEPGFCTDGEITGGNGLMGQDVYTELVVIEKTGGTYQYQYEIHDWTNELHEDLQQDASNHDFRGYYEYYDVFLSDADGTFNPNGSFVTVQARSDLSTTNLGVGHNIDAIGIRDANGNVLYASEIVSVGLGDGLGSNNPDGRQSAILGPADEIPTALGNGQAQITVGFCPTLVEAPDEPSPGFGAMAALAALGAAMFAGRRGLLDEQDAE